MILASTAYRHPARGRGPPTKSVVAGAVTPRASAVCTAPPPASLVHLPVPGRIRGSAIAACPRSPSPPLPPPRRARRLRLRAARAVAAHPRLPRRLDARWSTPRRPSARRCWRGYAFGVGHFTVNNNWFQHAFDFQDAMPPVLGYFAAVGAGALSRGLPDGRGRASPGASAGERPDAAYVLIFAAAWIATE